jgi:uncharacterized membrane-anchored protein
MKKYAAIMFVVWASGAGLAVAQEQELPAGWTPGPVAGKLGDRATISVPEGFMFLDRSATRAFLEQNQNIPDGDELGTVLRIMPNDDFWFAVFSYSESGHIDNSDRNSLEPDPLMKVMMEGNRQSNEQRKKRGWSALTLQGWHQPPFYDAATDNLTWSTRLSSDNAPVINHSVRLLGRTGLMSAQLVADVAGIDEATTEFNSVLGTYSFNEGHRYAEFRQGDKLAGYGLAALIAGGAGAAAVKTGLLKKFWKLLVLGFVGLVGAIKKLLGGRGAAAGSQEPVAVGAGNDEWR